MEISRQFKNYSASLEFFDRELIGIYFNEIFTQ